MEESYSYCEMLVREADKDRFLASLFAPADRRPHLFALYAFNIEISRVRETSHNALPGEMRLQWWRDALSGRGYGSVTANPVATALLDTMVRYRLSATPLLGLLQARSFDLYDEPMPTLAEFESYACSTSSSLIEFAASILVGGTSASSIEPARHAGLAYAIAGLLRALPVHAARGQVYLPADVLERHGAARQDIFAGTATWQLRAALAEMRLLARRHLAALNEGINDIPAAAAPAFIPVALVPPLLARMEHRRYDPFMPFELSQWRKQWAMWRATWGGILGLP
jgi:15-cis-phytoene synthase